MTTSSNQKTGSHPLDVYGDAKYIIRIFYWFAVAILLALAAGVVASLLINNIPSALPYALRQESRQCY